MRSVLPRLTLVVALTLVCAACVTPSAQVAYGGGPATVVGAGPHVSRLDVTDRGWWGRRGWAAPVPGYGRGLTERPAVVCDTFGRCWRQEQPIYGRPGYGSGPPWVTRRDGWSDDRLFGRRGRSEDRFVRTDRRVVCDRATAVCYKRGEVDKSETEDVFGERAGDRADDLRDDLGTARLFVPERGVTCDRGRRACFDDGAPDHSLTRRYFGRRAAGALD